MGGEEVIWMEPYREFVADIIQEEFAQQSLRVRELPDRVQEALTNIERRIANYFEVLNRPVGGVNKG